MSGDAFGHRVGEDVEIVRGALCQILKDNILDGEFIVGDSIRAISQRSDGVKVEFTKNTPREFDLVIGADGLHSNVRGIVFGEEARFIRDLGLYLCVYTVPNYLNLDRVEIQYSELGRIAALWSYRGDASAKACFGFAVPSIHIDLRDRAQQQQVLTNVYKDIGWEVPRLLEMMPDAADYYFDVAAQIHMPHWSQGRVVLAGDAGYCASPMSGQGTSLALISAYVLAGELAAASGAYQTAFDRYEREMRPFVMLNQALGLKSANLMRSKEQRNLSTWLLEKMMQIAPGRMWYFLSIAPLGVSTKLLTPLTSLFRLIEPGGGSRLMCLVAAYVVTRMDHVIRPRQLHGHWGHCSSPVKLKARDIARDFFTRGGRQDRR
jgi:2-polyprenyl-6-methoxyphenol hydroxylase-like FAD-dependent oxidoreductase